MLKTVWLVKPAMRCVVITLPVQARIEEVVQDLEPLQIASIVWSLGKLKHHPGIELMEALLATVNVNIAGFTPQVITWKPLNVLLT